MPVPLRKCVSRSADAEKPASANPVATLTPVAWSVARVAVSQLASGVSVNVSWLPLAGTGLTPVTVKAELAPAG